MPIDPVAKNTIEDENDAEFELDDLFAEPNNRSMAAVIAHSQQLVFVDERIQEYFFSKAKELLKRNVGRLTTNESLGYGCATCAVLCWMGFRWWLMIRS
jgi:hypothetical protein